jgi:thiamine monophosphate kinase
MQCCDGMYLLLKRRDAHLVDLLCTTGALGSAVGRLWAWQQKLESNPITKLREPEPRLAEGRPSPIAGRSRP